MRRTDQATGENRWSYLRVAEMLRQEILSGIYRPGKRMPGEPVLAKRFGVGRVTVAKALEILQQSNLVFRLQGSGTYVQRDVARGAVSLTIGYMVEDVALLRGTPSGVVLEAAQQYLEERGHGVRLMTLDEVRGGGEPTANIRRMIRSGVINGLIITDVLNYELIHALGEVLPTVCGSSDLAPDNVMTVTVDYMLGYFLAIRHLLDLGHRTIGLLGGKIGFSVGYRAYQAFRLALQLAGIDPQSCPVMSSGFSPEMYRPHADEMLRDNPDMTAMLCADDVAAAAVIEGAWAIGKSVPGQLSVVGCNDLRAAAMCQPSLTTLHIDFSRLGRQLAETVVARIYGREGMIRYYIKPELIVRGSTAPLHST